MKKIVNSIDECEAYYEFIDLTMEDIFALKNGKIITQDIDGEEYAVAIRCIGGACTVTDCEYVDKSELAGMIEHSICSRCQHYNHGEYSGPCRICKVSQVFQCISLATEHRFLKQDEIGIGLDEDTDQNSAG